MSHWSFQRKLVTGVVLICVLAIFASVVSVITARSLITSMTKITTADGPDLAEVRTLQLAGLKTIADVRACLLPGGQAFAPETRAGITKAHDLIAQLRPRIGDPEGRALLDRVAAAERAHSDAFESAQAIVGVRAGPAPTIGPESVLALSIAFDRTLAALVVNREAARARSLAPALAVAKRSEGLLVGFSIAKIMLMVLLCLIISLALTRSYGEQTAARAVAESGQTQVRVTLSEVEAVGRLKDEFLAIVSHELRNPLAPILTWTQLLRGGTLDREKTARALEVIERNVLSQTRLIDDLMDVSRVVSGKFRLDVRSVDLVPVIRAAAEFHTPASEAKAIRLHLRLDEQPQVMSGDPERLQQLMSNLISNAIKFTPKGGEVEVVLQRRESDIEVEVRDNGIGIEPAFLPHVFEPFRQGAGGTTRRQGGLGLGLSIVRHIVELHGGEIVAHSDGPDQGSKFIVTFPFSASSAVDGVAS